LREKAIRISFYSYTEEELALLELHGNSWENEEYTDLKNKIRKYLLKENNGLCFYCKTEVSLGTSYVPIEHIVSKADYPDFTFTPQNLTVACTRCNTSKGKQNVLTNKCNNLTEYPSAHVDYQIIHAYIDKYGEHIDIIDDVMFLSKSHKGKNTIEMCDLYRLSLLEEKMKKNNARRYLDLLFIKIENETISNMNKEDIEFIPVNELLSYSWISDEIKQEILQYGLFLIDLTKIKELYSLIIGRISENQFLIKVYSKITSIIKINDVLNNISETDLLFFYCESFLSFLDKKNIRSKISNVFHPNVQSLHIDYRDYLSCVKNILQGEHLRIEEYIMKHTSIQKHDVILCIDFILINNSGSNVKDLMALVRKHYSISRALNEVTDYEIELLEADIKRIMKYNLDEGTLMFILKVKKITMLKKLFYTNGSEFIIGNVMFG